MAKAYDIPLLEIKDIWVFYGRVAALHGVSVEVREGEAVSVIGPNGAGKSTLLAAVMGTVRCKRGEILYQGASLLGQAPERVVRRGVALVPERRQIFTTLTVAENLELGTTVRDDRDAAAADLEDVLELFPVLRTRMRLSAAKLSGGEQQQLAIARALLCKPRLLLLDEPSFGLSPLLVGILFDVLSELRQRGATILLVEQNAVRAIEFGDRTYLLETGRIAREGTRDQFHAEDADVSNAYLGVEFE